MSMIHAANRLVLNEEYSDRSGPAASVNDRDYLRGEAGR